MEVNLVQNRWAPVTVNRIEFVHLWLSILKGVAVVLCMQHVCVCTSLQLLQHFSVWLQICWYTCVTIFYDYKIHCHRCSPVLHQIYLHTTKWHLNTQYQNKSLNTKPTDMGFLGPMLIPVSEGQKIPKIRSRSAYIVHIGLQYSLNVVVTCDKDIMEAGYLPS